jgi:O-methyltransferase
VAPNLAVDERLRSRYLELLKGCLTRTLFDENYRKIPRNTRTPLRRLRTAALDLLQAVLGRAQLELVDTRGASGETMIGLGALNHLHRCIEDVLQRNVPGDFIETGVWKGGATIFMRAALEAYGDSTRCVWAADSFQGLPPPNPMAYPADRGSTLWRQSLAVSVEEVQRNFARYGLLDERVRFLVGFFSETIPGANIGPLAILRLDGDMYESTIVVLRHLYQKVSPGGYVIFDEYGMIPACTQAVHDFRLEAGIEEPLEFIGHLAGKPLGAYWRRSA